MNSLHGLPPINILVVSRSEDVARCWATILGDRETRVWLSASELSSPVQLDVVVTDGPPCDLPFGVSEPTAPRSPAERATSGGGRSPGVAAVPPEGPSCLHEADRPGVIAVGDGDWDGQADVCLPVDVAPRELRLACRLLAEIVRLRRALAARTHAERRLAVEALTDPLTGIPNRRAWDQRLQECLTLQAGPNASFCLAILDLDRFKQVNDASGHVVGDRVLRTVGRTLGENLRHGDFVARLGGDEFGLLLAVPDAATARSVVDRVRRALPAGLARDGLPAVTASAGLCHGSLAQGVAPPRSFDPLVAVADSALREAKSLGRDRTEASVM